MPALVDNMYYYMAYGLILVVFVIVLKSPKKPKNNEKSKDDKNPKDDKKDLESK
ncbi:MAG: hypothetical protein GQ531_10730 [Sulfurovum sp.]|nr:hypothetical protein [Sulfurovum sp.]